PGTSTLRQVLAKKLPDHMVPSTFIVLDAMPRTATGKIDRRALPPPDGRRPVLETAFVPPRTAVEAVLASTWEAVLSVAPVGVHDNFLELGGDSLLATQVISRVLSQYHVQLP